MDEKKNVNSIIININHILYANQHRFRIYIYIFYSDGCGSYSNIFKSTTEQYMKWSKRNDNDNSFFAFTFRLNSFRCDNLKLAIVALIEKQQKLLWLHISLWFVFWSIAISLRWCYFNRYILCIHNDDTRKMNEWYICIVKNYHFYSWPQFDLDLIEKRILWNYFNWWWSPNLTLSTFFFHFDSYVDLKLNLDIFVTVFSPYGEMSKVFKPKKFVETVKFSVYSVYNRLRQIVFFYKSTYCEFSPKTIDLTKFVWKYLKSKWNSLLI